MYRYGFVPLLLITLCACYVTVTYQEAELIYIASSLVEGKAPLARYNAFFWSRLGDILLGYFGATALWGAFIGGIVACAFVVCDTFRNGVVDRSGRHTAKRLVLNLFWCAFYVLAANILKMFVALALKAAHLPSPAGDAVLAVVDISPVLLLAGMNLIAILWSTFRAINTSDILTPRVLLSKLRRSTRLEAATS